MKCFTELIKIPTFYERFEYLKLDSKIGIETFGVDRYLNQVLYKSREWQHIRDIVITRDCGCDLAVPGLEINTRIIVHHMNPITLDQVLERDPIIFDPELLISVSHKTHNGLHYGHLNKESAALVERKPYDTCPWR